MITLFIILAVLACIGLALLALTLGGIVAFGDVIIAIVVIVLIVKLIKRIKNGKGKES